MLRDSFVADRPADESSDQWHQSPGGFGIAHAGASFIEPDVDPSSVVRALAGSQPRQVRATSAHDLAGRRNATVRTHVRAISVGACSGTHDRDRGKTRSRAGNRPSKPGNTDSPPSADPPTQATKQTTAPTPHSYKPAHQPPNSTSSTGPHSTAHNMASGRTASRSQIERPPAGPSITTDTRNRPWREGLAREPVTCHGLGATGWTAGSKNTQVRGTGHHRME